MSGVAIDLRSDTVTRPDPEMRRAMASAEVGDDVFGEDPTVIRLEAASADATGHESALFVPSGTMANEIALQVHAPRGSEVICEAESHVFHYERGGMAALSGRQKNPTHRVDVAETSVRGPILPAEARRREDPMAL